ncbi:MAG: hypothetical protein U5K27_14870 [Desulfotignum sp.]|nr:hypothetical protein [Desulfotignum sp.]
MKFQGIQKLIVLGGIVHGFSLEVLPIRSTWSGNKIVILRPRRHGVMARKIQLFSTHALTVPVDEQFPGQLFIVQAVRTSFSKVKTLICSMVRASDKACEGTTLRTMGRCFGTRMSARVCTPYAQQGVDGPGLAPTTRPWRRNRPPHR